MSSFINSRKVRLNPIRFDVDRHISKWSNESVQFDSRFFITLFEVSTCNYILIITGVASVPYFEISQSSYELFGLSEMLKHVWCIIIIIIIFLLAQRRKEREEDEKETKKSKLTSFKDEEDGQSLDESPRRLEKKDKKDEKDKER